MIIIGLGNKARHGKNYAATQMALRCAQTYGKLATLYGFADSLKAHCRVAYGMRDKDAPLLQMVGTELYRRMNPNIWVNVLIDTIREQAPEVAIITDVRFPNEADALKSLGGILVRVSRFNEDGTDFVAPDRSPTHPSEIALDNYSGWDYHFKVKTGDLETLTAASKQLVDIVMSPVVA